MGRLPGYATHVQHQIVDQAMVVNSVVADQVLELPAEELMLRLQAELADSKLLQAISTEIALERNAEAL